ncbi:hypothetical protein [uncultured Muribaculum sp.]|uniref:hypothetical protein n=1 Tax=uncultured Muribaculum sp. TaxID=1918613 RepID=UPI0027305206|nr:hypothetical protein [uncultured Muribaculum sp.]
MSKTIEEAAREYAKDRVGDYDYLGNEYEAYLDGSNDTVEWLFSLPLSQRLTDEERERVIKLYIDANDKLKSCLNAMNHNQISELDNEYKKGINMGLILALKYIFGKELFGEGEGC